MKIRFLYFEGCPNGRPALERLETVIREAGIDGPIEMVEVTSPGQAVQERFLGSPSIQVNGRDIESARAEDPPFFGCRVYLGDHGPSGIPPVELIRSALREAMEPSLSPPGREA
ncbi:MAG TPA: DUF2703 domain-containing protein [Candidatus Hydrogenedentes bacterium]|nr:DUF2703 domain-containing protein [Candidatus Hydrogenedentota bacterium]